MFLIVGCENNVLYKASYKKCMLVQSSIRLVRPWRESPVSVLSNEVFLYGKDV